MCYNVRVDRPLGRIDYAEINDLYDNYGMWFGAGAKCQSAVAG